MPKPPAALNRGRMRHVGCVRGADCPLPGTPGVYRHVDRTTREVAYVGQTNDLRRRQQEHERAGRLDLDRHRVEYGPAKSASTRDHWVEAEKEHIRRHRPSGNATGGGNGRR